MTLTDLLGQSINDAKDAYNATLQATPANINAQTAQMLATNAQAQQFAAQARSQALTDTLKSVATNPTDLMLLAVAGVLVVILVHEHKG